MTRASLFAPLTLLAPLALAVVVIALLAWCSITVQADGDHNTPEFDDDSTTMSFPENSPVGRVVGQVSASDYEYPPLDRRPRQHQETVILYSLEGPDKRSFNIERFAGAIRANRTYNYEADKHTYSVTVRAANGKGESDTIDVTINLTDVKERSGTPLPPTVNANPDSNTSLDVSWKKPKLKGGPDIVRYGLQYRELPVGAWANQPHSGTATTATITGLTPGTEYQVRVKADNGEKLSRWSKRGRGSTGAADSG